MTTPQEKRNRLDRRYILQMIHQLRQHPELLENDPPLLDAAEKILARLTRERDRARERNRA
jgi:hypothetical protein